VDPRADFGPESFPQFLTLFTNVTLLLLDFASGVPQVFKGSPLFTRRIGLPEVALCILEIIPRISQFTPLLPNIASFLANLGELERSGNLDGGCGCGTRAQQGSSGIESELLAHNATSCGAEHLTRCQDKPGDYRAVPPHSFH
jgi:hypothetical protein